MRGRTASRQTRSLRTLAVLVVLALLLALTNAFLQRRELNLALGDKGPAQLDYFLRAAEAPDSEAAFGKLAPQLKLRYARNVAAYNDPRLAKLEVRLLVDFDASARAVLTEGLKATAQTDPDAVAAQLDKSNTFQVLGVSAALLSTKDRAIPAVAKRLEKPEARSNAESYLLDIGPESVPEFLQELSSADSGARLAAADALGKLHATQAAEKLVALYGEAKPEERSTYLVAIGSLGSPAAEPILTKALQDPALTPAQREQAALGLGRIATSSAVSLLVPLLKSQPEIAVHALQLAGDPALGVSLDPATNLKIAGGVHSSKADAFIRAALQSDHPIEAADAAANRPALVPDLVSLAKRIDGDSQGDIASAAIAALDTTAEGRVAIKELERNPGLEGFVRRQLVTSPN